MGRCCSQGLDEAFGERTARRDLKRYRRKGPSKSTRRLLAAVRSHGVEGASLLDIGGGVGAIQHELLEAGVTRAFAADASAAYLRAARAEAERRGLDERVSAYEGDFVALADDIPAADLVTLDRVVCCYPDMQALVGRSAAHARRVYGLVHPRDRWWTRLAFRVANLAFGLVRTQFRAYVHPVAAIDAVAGDRGLALRSRETVGPIWQVTVYTRA